MLLTVYRGDRKNINEIAGEGELMRDMKQDCRWGPYFTLVVRDDFSATFELRSEHQELSRDGAGD